MSNEQTQSLGDFLDTMLSDALMQLRKCSVMPSKMRRKSLVGFPGKSATFTRWDAITDNGGKNELTSSAVSATVDEHLIMTTITDLAMNAAEPSDNSAGVLLGNAMSNKVDSDCVELFGGFKYAVAGAGVALSMDHIFQAIQHLRNANAPGPYYGVFHPKQVWGPKGFAGLTPPEAQQDLSELSRIAGIEIDISTEIDDDVACGGDAAGGIFSPAALGLVDKGFFNTEVQRDAKLKGTVLVVQGLWKEVEILDQWGVYVLSDVS